MSAWAESLAWAPHVLAIELKKVLTYRMAFWIRYLLGTLTELTIAYYLWGSLFAQNESGRMQGFSFHGILFYSVFASLGSKLVWGSAQGSISQEIYDGSLNRYLLYPLSFTAYKYVALLAQQLIAAGQLLLGLALAIAVWGLPSDLSITASSVALGVVTAFLCGGVLFLINGCLELVAFWQDTVWNLMAMLRFIGGLLGGLLVPLSFFPEWGQKAVQLTPFPVIFTFPIRCFLGQVNLTEWLHSAQILLLWAVAAACAMSWIWHRGTRQYSGVGI